jgi:hypothetical protein
MFANQPQITQPAPITNDLLPDPWAESVAVQPTSALSSNWPEWSDPQPLIAAAGMPTALRIGSPQAMAGPNPTQSLLLDAIKLGQRIDQSLWQSIGELLALLYWVSAI